MTAASKGTLDGMAPLTAEQIEDRLRELDNDLKAARHDYGRLAEAKVRAARDRELAMAQAFGQAAGTPTEKRQASIAAVGRQGVDEEAAYARIAADVELLTHRAMVGASLLKAAQSRDRDLRYASGR